MRKLLILSGIIAGVTFSAVAEGKKGEFRNKFTDEQKACIEQYGCTMPNPDKIGTTDASAEDEAKFQESRECMKKAMESCGIERSAMKEKNGKGKKWFKKKSEQ